jgi:MGT family glycosyltransferase
MNTHDAPTPRARREKTACFFANIGVGHLNPMLVLAARLAARGWTVYFYAHDNARRRVADSGAVWRSYGHDSWDLFETAKRATRELLEMEPEALQDMSIVSAGLPAALAMLPYLLGEIERHRPLFTVHDAAAPWGALAGRMAGVPTVCSMSAFPLTVEQAAETYPPGAIQSAAARYLLRRHGVEYDPCAGYVNYTDCNLVFTSRLWAGRAFDAATTYHFCGPALFDEAAEALRHPSVEVAEAARSAGKRLVYASMGTVVNGTLSTFYRETVYRIFAGVVAALKPRDDVRLIISAGRKAGAGPAEPLPLFGADALPGNVSVYDYVPQPLLLRRADLFVTHAGMNSSNEAAWHGVPVLCCPFFGDGVLNARRFEELGAGLTLDYGVASPALVAAGRPPASTEGVPPEALRSALYDLLDQASYRRAAASLRRQFRREVELDASVDRMLAWVMKGSRHRRATPE